MKQSLFRAFSCHITGATWVDRPSQYPPWPGYPDWVEQFRTNIVNHKADRLLLKPFFFTMKQSLFGVICCHIGVPLGLFGHSSTPHGYPDWLRQFRTNIVNHKAVRFLLKPSFYAMKQFLFGVVCWHIWVAPWVVWASPRKHGGTPCGYPDWLGQFITNIVTHFILCHETISVWNHFLLNWECPMGGSSIPAPLKIHRGNSWGYPEWLQ